MDPNIRPHETRLAPPGFDASTEVPRHMASPETMLRILDEIDYGLALLSAGGHLRHANQLAFELLRGAGALLLRAGRVQTRDAAQQTELALAVAAAIDGRRRLLTLATADGECPVALIPLADAGLPSDGPPMCLMLMGKRQACEWLSLTFFSQAHGLTPAEASVLRALCGGQPPKNIARDLGVAVSTVRTQIGSVRSKTQTHSIRELVQRIAALPPITLALKSVALN